MDKQSAAKYAQVVADVAQALRSVSAERDQYREKLAAYERRDHAFKVACAMHDKGLYREETLEGLTARLEKDAAEGRLAEIERAVDLVVPSVGVKLASVSDEPSGVGSKTAWESYIING